MKNRMRKSQKAKVLGTLTIVLVIFCAIALFCVSRVNSMQHQAITAQMNYTLYADEFGDASGYLTDQVRSYAATGDETYYNNYWYEINTAKNRDKNVEAMKAMGLTTEEQAMVDSIFSISNNLVPLEEDAMEYTKKGNLIAAAAILYGDTYEDGVADIRATIERFDASIQKRAQEKVDSLVIFTTIFSIISYIAVVITLIVQLCLVKFILQELIAPIVKIRGKMLEFAEGDLNHELDLEEDNTETGETVRAIHEFQNFQKELITDMDMLLGQMAVGNFDVDTGCESSYKGNYANILVSLRKINTTLNNTLQDIQIAADQVEVGSDQVASGAQALSQGATEQASSTEELAATITDISSHVKMAGDYALEASGKASEAGTLTNSCNAQMQEMVHAMNNISNTSQEIGKIIKTIEDIAFQTNILALNAAVEAARAGTAGKGFAVVADEVRNLAAKSAEASKNTSALIEASMAAVDEGAKIAGNTADRLQAVLANSIEISDMVNKIALATEEQAASIQQVSIGVDQISAVVQNNSATSEQSAAASEELAGQAQTLKKMVRKFKLRSTEGNVSMDYSTQPLDHHMDELYSYPSTSGRMAQKY